MSISSDLRKRVLEFIAAGGTKAEAARRFGVGEASIYRWLKSTQPLVGRKPGPKGGYKLDHAALAAHVSRYSNMTYAERAAHFGVSESCIGYALKKLGIRQKNAARQRTTRDKKKTVSEASKDTSDNSK